MNKIEPYSFDIRSINNGCLLKNMPLIYPVHCEFTAYQSSASAELLISQLTCCHQPTAEVWLPSQLNLCHRWSWTAIDGHNWAWEFTSVIVDHEQQLKITTQRDRRCHSQSWTAIEDHNSLSHLMSQQTWDIHPMFDQCWASYVDVGPILVQYYLAAFNWLASLNHHVHGLTTTANLPTMCWSRQHNGSHNS